MDFSRSLIITILCVFFSLSEAGAGGLSEGRQEYLLESLRSYIPMDYNVKKTVQQNDPLASNCDPREVATSQYCLEKKYIKDGYYIVTVAYLRSADTPEQPEASYIDEGGRFKKDISKREAFLNEWSDPLLREYVGDDYNKFNSVKLEAVNSRAVIVKIEVSEAEELRELLTDPRIILVRHVGDPERPLEEVAD